MKKFDRICLFAALPLTLFLTLFRIDTFYKFDGEFYRFGGISFKFRNTAVSLRMPLNDSWESNVDKIYVVYGLLRLAVPVITALLFVRAAKRVWGLEKKQTICGCVLPLAALYLTMFYDMRFGYYGGLPAMNILCIVLLIASISYCVYLTLNVSKKRVQPEI